ncbi:MAG: anti-sigma factor [Egibacteraceae bacterium]
MTADVHAMAGAYALHALPADERAFFERHITVCEACHLEVDEFATTAALLGSASADAPPPVLREQVLRAVDVTRQAPPAQLGAPPAQRSGRRLLEMVLGGVAASLAVALLVLSGVTVAMNERLGELEAAAPTTVVDDRALAVLAAPDAKTRPLAAEGGAAGRFVYSPRLDMGVFVARDLAPLPPDSTYELWLYHDGTPVPATVFDPDDHGRALTVVEGSVTGAESAAVTVEPHGGSPAPTGGTVLQGSV